MGNFIDIILISKRRNFQRNIRLSFGLAVAGVVIFVVLFISTLTLFIYNIQRTYSHFELQQQEVEHEKLLRKLDSLRQYLKYTEDRFNSFIAQDNRERTYWQMAYIHPDIWSMGIGGKKYKPISESISNCINRRLDEIYESLDILKGKCMLRKTSLVQLYQKQQKDFQLWSHIPSINPVPGHRIGSGFGYRVDPIDKKTIRMHWGVDIGAPKGTLIYATADGVVSYVGWNHGYGLMVDIDHGYGFRTRYAHCSSILVKPGDFVKRGQAIARVGATGRTTCSHLHYEVHVSGVKVNPAKYISFASNIID
ncbi:hypothetical protein BXT86_04580 [candidate division WOR-3 bacterium 4484_100]|uniref:M23ase beta-sheet core domain-containing protein n=1 Tax=candidate division WOR-3 bacterium 4484_100 TaxID=1936077 RepID=A0A1V4QF11_UNCW3|nr:MAG: hypothetical protein BXT86_04580 [candidate division WOR-3 bacterium 4484_100]